MCLGGRYFESATAPNPQLSNRDSRFPVNQAALLLKEPLSLAQTEALARTVDGRVLSLGHRAAIFELPTKTEASLFQSLRRLDAQPQVEAAFPFGSKQDRHRELRPWALAEHVPGGCLDRPEWATARRAIARGIRGCWEKLKTRAVVDVNMLVSPRGRVMEVNVHEMPSATPLAHCVDSAVREVTFPKFDGYPLNVLSKSFFVPESEEARLHRAAIVTQLGASEADVTRLVASLGGHMTMAREGSDHFEFTAPTWTGEERDTLLARLKTSPVVKYAGLHPPPMTSLPEAAHCIRKW